MPPAPSEPAQALMRDALSALLQGQLRGPAGPLPEFDEALMREQLALFSEWCVQREFGVSWTAVQQQAWQRVCDRLVASALAQPRVPVHGDWTLRQLAAEGGTLDFQGRFIGPLTHDLACLLRDAAIGWDEAQELDVAVRWWQQARAAGLPLGDVFEADFGEFWRALEWTGLQHHLKSLGLQCRRKHRDGKAIGADALSHAFGHATRVALRYGPLKPLLGLLEPLSGQRVASGFTF